MQANPKIEIFVYDGSDWIRISATATISSFAAKPRVIKF